MTATGAIWRWRSELVGKDRYETAKEISRLVFLIQSLEMELLDQLPTIDDAFNLRWSGDNPEKRTSSQLLQARKAISRYWQKAQPAMVLLNTEAWKAEVLGIEHAHIFAELIQVHLTRYYIFLSRNSLITDFIWETREELRNNYSKLLEIVEPHILRKSFAKQVSHAIDYVTSKIAKWPRRFSDTDF